jgi:8-oxo-dGTP diphosphatase
MKHIKVVAAIIQHEDKILCVQRDESKYDYISYKWEFPGGKIEDGETSQEALKREIREELNIEINVGDELMTNTHEYPDFTIEMTSFLCTTESTELKLSVHTDYLWLSNEGLIDPDWAAADTPIVAKLINS